MVAAVMAIALGASSAAAAPSANGISHRRVCPHTQAGYAHCDSFVAVNANGKPARQQPVDYTGTELETAYGLAGPSTSDGSGPTIAIVDAYGYPSAQSDLNVYRAANGMQACGAGCFTRLDQNGGTTAPAANDGWAQETALDLDMASAACPKCKLLLVQANSNSLADLSTAANTAAAQPGVVAISNSYGSPEFSLETSSTYAAPYNHPGIAITVSSGDNGYGVEYPASSNTVVAVGGTSLRTTSTGAYSSESAWSGAGSGCSAYFPKPSFQGSTGCSRRMVADVSAVADPNTGVDVYDTYGSGTGWMVFGGTSASAPLIAGVYAAQNDLAGVTYPASLPYGRTNLLHDVTSGSNGRCRGVPASFCGAVSGYDGPTGLGSPSGSGAF